jgi:hypothetical protein
MCCLTVVYCCVIDYLSQDAEFLLAQIDPEDTKLPYRLSSDTWEFFIDQLTNSYRWQRGVFPGWGGPGDPASLLGRDLKKLVVLDTKFQHREGLPDNMLYIKPWDFRDHEDPYFFYDLHAMLRELVIREVYDVRPIIRQFSDVADLALLLRRHRTAYDAYNHVPLWLQHDREFQLQYGAPARLTADDVRNDDPTLSRWLPDSPY